MKYNVEIPEVHKAIIEVELPEGTVREKIITVALDKFENGEDFECEYSHTIDDQDEWTVRNINGDFIL